MTDTWTVTPIARVRSSRRDIVDDDWDAERVTIELLPPFGPDAVRGLDAFSHIDVIYLFDRVDPARVHTGARHPRGNTDCPDVGVFAQRVKDRPNRLGLSTVELLEVDGVTLHVRGRDAIDGTPVIDIKPHMEEFGPRTPIREPSWARELMAGYW